jgi:hypothetical protein
LALIVAGAALLTTLLTSWLNARQLRQSKAQDYERQDAVAAQAAVAAALLEQRQDAVTKKAAEAARLLLAASGWRRSPPRRRRSRPANSTRYTSWSTRR